MSKGDWGKPSPISPLAPETLKGDFDGGGACHAEVFGIFLHLVQ